MVTNKREFVVTPDPAGRLIGLVSTFRAAVEEEKYLRYRACKCARVTFRLPCHSPASDATQKSFQDPPFTVLFVPVQIPHRLLGCHCFCSSPLMNEFSWLALTTASSTCVRSLWRRSRTPLIVALTVVDQRAIAPFINCILFATASSSSSLCS